MLDAATQTSPEQLLSTTDDSSPLHHADILHHVLSFVGPGHWLLLAKVSSLWHKMYQKVDSAIMNKAYSVYTDPCFTCIPQMTLYSAVFSSPSRVRLADIRIIRCTALQYERAAGMYADVATLQAAHELGMPYTLAVMLGAAHCNDLAVVQYLRAQGCPWGRDVFSRAAGRGDTDLCAYLYANQCPWDAMASAQAARHGHASTLRWLRERGCPCDDDQLHIPAAVGGSVEVMVYLQQQGLIARTSALTEMLRVAGAYQHLAAVTWLREEGAQWPTVLCRSARQWSGDTLAWARAEGCTSPIE
jgi:hypothetical protein